MLVTCGLVTQIIPTLENNPLYGNSSLSGIACTYVLNYIHFKMKFEQDTNFLTFSIARKFFLIVIGC